MKRGNGEGAIRQRTSGLWEARYFGPDGQRRSVYAKTTRSARGTAEGAGRHGGRTAPGASNAHGRRMARGMARGHGAAGPAARGRSRATNS